MSKRAEIRYPVLKSTLVVAFTILVLSLTLGAIFGWLLAAHLISPSPSPALIGVVLIIVPTVAGAAWFRFRTNREMFAGERLRFGAGVVATNIIILIGKFAGFLASAGETRFTAKYGISAREVFSSYVSGTLGTWLGLVTQLLIFAQAYVLGWIVTRRGKRDGPPDFERIFGNG